MYEYVQLHFAESVPREVCLAITTQLGAFRDQAQVTKPAMPQAPIIEPTPYNEPVILLFHC